MFQLSPFINLPWNKAFPSSPCDLFENKSKSSKIGFTPRLTSLGLGLNDKNLRSKLLLALFTQKGNKEIITYTVWILFEMYCKSFWLKLVWCVFTKLQILLWNSQISLPLHRDMNRIDLALIKSFFWSCQVLEKFITQNVKLSLSKVVENIKAKSSQCFSICKSWALNRSSGIANDVANDVVRLRKRGHSSMELWKRCT